MIEVTRLNGSKVWISADMIESFESTPDTIICMTSGKKVIATESPEQLRDAIIDYKRRCNQQLP